MKTTLMIQARASDMMVCKWWGGAARFAWQLIAVAVNLPSSARHSFLGSANHLVQSLSLDDLLLSIFVCGVSSIHEAVLMEMDPVG